MAPVAVRILHNDTEFEKQVSSLTPYVFVYDSVLSHHISYSPERFLCHGD